MCEDAKRCGQRRGSRTFTATKSSGRAIATSVRRKEEVLSAPRRAAPSTTGVLRKSSRLRKPAGTSRHQRRASYCAACEAGAAWCAGAHVHTMS